MLKLWKNSQAKGRGWSDVKITVYLSGVSKVHCLAWTAKFAVPCGLSTCSMFQAMSALVNSRPVWNCTPLRRLNLICLRSLLAS